jgi:hypothetical protein
LSLLGVAAGGVADAANPAVLTERVGAAAANQRGAALAAFLTTGTSELSPDELLAALSGWTATATAALPEPTRVLLQLLAAIEPDHRISPVLRANWGDVWRRLALPGDRRSLAEALAPLLAAALVDLEPYGDPNDPNRPVHYRIHPGVADTARAATPAAVLTAADTQLAAFCLAVFDDALKREDEGSGQLLMSAALAAAPYLLRLQERGIVSVLLERALLRDQSPPTVAAILQSLQRIADATRGSDRELIDEGLVARALATVDPAQAEVRLRAVLEQALEREDYGGHLKSSGSREQRPGRRITMTQPTNLPSSSLT